MFSGHFKNDFFFNVLILLILRNSEEQKNSSCLPLRTVRPRVLQLIFTYNFTI